MTKTGMDPVFTYRFRKELNMPRVNGKKYPYTAAGKKAAAAARKKKKKVGKKRAPRRRMGY